MQDAAESGSVEHVSYRLRVVALLVCVTMCIIGIYLHVTYVVRIQHPRSHRSYFFPCFLPWLRWLPFLEVHLRVYTMPYGHGSFRCSSTSRGKSVGELRSVVT